MYAQLKASIICHHKNESDSLHKKALKGLRYVLDCIKEKSELEVIVKNVEKVYNKLNEAVMMIKMDIGLSKTTRIGRQNSKWIIVNDKDSSVFDSGVLKSLSSYTKSSNTILDSIFLSNSFKLTAEESRKLKLRDEKPINKRIIEKQSVSNTILDVGKTMRITNASKIIFSIIKSTIKKYFHTIKAYRFDREVIRTTYDRGNSVKLVARKGSLKPFSVISVKGDTLKKSLVDYSTPKGISPSIKTNLDASRVSSDSSYVRVRV